MIRMGAILHERRLNHGFRDGTIREEIYPRRVTKEHEEYEKSWLGLSYSCTFVTLRG